MTAVSAPRDAVKGTNFKFGVLLNRKPALTNDIEPSKHHTYALLLNYQTLDTIAEYEISFKKQLTTGSDSIYYRESDDTLFVLVRKEAGKYRVGLIVVH